MHATWHPMLPERHSSEAERVFSAKTLVGHLLILMPEKRPGLGAIGGKQRFDFDHQLLCLSVRCSLFSFCNDSTACQARLGVVLVNLSDNNNLHQRALANSCKTTSLSRPTPRSPDHCICPTSSCNQPPISFLRCRK